MDGYEEDVGVGTGRVARHDLVVVAQAHADDALCGPARGPHLALVEPDGTWVLYFYTLGDAGFNGAGEIGHAVVVEDGRLCNCGNYGCLEAYASGPNIALRACEEIKAGAVSRLAQYVDGDLRQITAQTVYQAAHDGEVDPRIRGSREAPRLVRRLDGDVRTGAVVVTA